MRLMEAHIEELEGVQRRLGEDLKLAHGQWEQKHKALQAAEAKNLEMGATIAELTSSRREVERDLNELREQVGTKQQPGPLLVQLFEQAKEERDVELRDEIRALLRERRQMGFVDALSVLLEETHIDATHLKPRVMKNPVALREVSSEEAQRLNDQLKRAAASVVLLPPIAPLPLPPPTTGELFEASQATEARDAHNLASQVHFPSPGDM